MSQFDASKKTSENAKKQVTLLKQTKLPVKTTTTATATKKPQKSTYIIPSKQTLNSKQNFENNDHQLQKHAVFNEKKEVPKVQVQE